MHEPFYFSYSSLNRLLYSPKSFYDYYILGQRPEVTESFLIDGKVTHALLLCTEEQFNEQYIISDLKLPQNKQKQLVDKVFKKLFTVSEDYDLVSHDLKDHSEKIEEVLKELNFYQKIIDSSKRVEKVTSEQNCEYFKFLIKKNNKILIDKETYERCLFYKEELLKNSFACEQMRLEGCSNSTESLEVINEKEFRGLINIPEKDIQLYLKGIPDNLVVDFKNKLITINDLKTTSRSLVDFKTSIESYNYWLQAVIYDYLIRYNFRGFSVKFNFIVIDKYGQIVNFVVSEKTMEEWYERFDEVLKKADYHYKTGQYSLPYDFKEGYVTI